MLFNSINYTFKEVFYILEKWLSGKKTDPLELSGSQFHPHRIERSKTSGEFLNRARRGETLKPDHEDTHEFVKEFVRLKAACQGEETQNGTEPKETARTLAKSSTDEVPIFGLKASLHASTAEPSFKAWKNVHQLQAIDAVEEISEQSVEHKIQKRTWRDLSVQSALRLIDHPNTPADVLFELAHHVDAEVRAQVADNANTPEEAIMLLLKDESIDVRLSLAECYHLGAAVLEMLVEDENPYVSDRAQTTLQRLTASENPAGASIIRGICGLEGVKTAAVTQIRARA